MQDAALKAVDAIRGISRTIQEVSGIATVIAAAVEQQGSATAEIARSIHQTTNNTESATTTIGKVSKSASDTGAAANAVPRASTSLSQRTQQLTAEVDRLIGGVRAA